MAGDTNGRVSISRDTLRAELAELELRLIDKLARKETVDRVIARMEDNEHEIAENSGLRIHEFPRLVKRIETIEATLTTPERVADIVDQALDSSNKKGWTTRERVMQVALVVISLASVILNFATHA